MGEEGKPSKLVCHFVLIADLLAVGLAVAAEVKRSRAEVIADRNAEYTYCVYDSDIATVYGIGACLLLAVSHGLTMDVTKFDWSGSSSLKPGASRAWTIVLFIASWLSFVIAEACLIWGTAKNANHTKHRGIDNVTYLFCEEVPKGVFATGAGATVLALAMNGLYHLVFVRAKQNERSAFLVSLMPVDGEHIDNNQKV